MDKKLLEFLKKLTILCHDYDLYIEGENLRVENGSSKIIVKDVEYDMEGQAYTTSFSELEKLRESK